MFNIFQHQPIRLYEKPVSTRYETVKVTQKICARVFVTAPYIRVGYGSERYTSATEVPEAS